MLPLLMSSIFAYCNRTQWSYPCCATLCHIVQCAIERVLQSTLQSNSRIEMASSKNTADTVALTISQRISKLDTINATSVLNVSKTSHTPKKKSSLTGYDTATTGKHKKHASGGKSHSVCYFIILLPMKKLHTKGFSSRPITFCIFLSEWFSVPASVYYLHSPQVMDTDHSKFMQSKPQHSVMVDFVITPKT